LPDCRDKYARDFISDSLEPHSPTSTERSEIDVRFVPPKRSTLDRDSLLRSPPREEGCLRFPCNRPSWNRLLNRLDSSERSFRPRIPRENAPLCLHSSAYAAFFLPQPPSFLPAPPVLAVTLSRELQWQSVPSRRDAVSHRARARSLTRVRTCVRDPSGPFCGKCDKGACVGCKRDEGFVKDENFLTSVAFLHHGTARALRSREFNVPEIVGVPVSPRIFSLCPSSGRARARGCDWQHDAMETTRCAHVPEEENLYQVYNHEKAAGNLVTLGKCAFPFPVPWGTRPSWDGQIKKSFYERFKFAQRSLNYKILKPWELFSIFKKDEPLSDFQLIH